MACLMNWRYCVEDYVLFYMGGDIEARVANYMTEIDGRVVWQPIFRSLFRIGRLSRWISYLRL